MSDEPIDESLWPLPWRRPATRGSTGGAGATSSLTVQRAAEVGVGPPWESARSGSRLGLSTRRGAQSRQTADHARDEVSGLSALTLHEWRGSGSTGTRAPRADSRSTRCLLRQGTRLTEVTPRGVADFIGWLVREPKRSGGTLADSSVRNALEAALGLSDDGKRDARFGTTPPLTRPCLDPLLPRAATSSPRLRGSPCEH